MTHSQSSFESTLSPEQSDLVAALLADLAAVERACISARVKFSHERRATVGGAFGSAPFGLRKVWAKSPLTYGPAQVARLVPDEAPRDELGGMSPAVIVREGFALVDYGWSFTYVRNLWRTRDYEPPRGGTWSLSSVVGILRHPAMAGFATFRGEVVLTSSGQPMSVHEPLVDPEVWDRVQRAGGRSGGASRGCRRGGS